MPTLACLALLATAGSCGGTAQVASVDDGVAAGTAAESEPQIGSATDDRPVLSIVVTEGSDPPPTSAVAGPPTSGARTTATPPSTTATASIATSNTATSNTATSNTATSNTATSNTATSNGATSTTAVGEGPATTAAAVTSQPVGAEAPGSPQTVRLRFESQVADVPMEDLQAQALAILNDERGWIRAGFTFVADPEAPYRVVLAEGAAVDALCLPLRTGGTVSCQNGPVVALNADRWRHAVDHWVLGVDQYRGYLVNHEVGHLIGQRHPTPRCPVQGRPAGVMEQQTGGLKGCVGNAWPREWEIAHAEIRPVVYAPLPDWGPDPIPANEES